MPGFKPERGVVEPQTEAHRADQAPPSSCGFDSGWSSRPQRAAVTHLLTPALLLLSLALGAPASGQDAGNGGPESFTRGVWLTNTDSDVLFDRNRLKEAIVELSQHGFDTLYPVAWNKGYTLHPSPTAQHWTGSLQLPHPGLANRDPLAEIIDHGQRIGMRVIPWFEYGLMLPADSPLARQYPQWLTRRADGSATWLLGGETAMVWLNPLHPQVQAMLIELLTELAGTYAVDGIQLDDHFGYHYQFGYDPYTLGLYHQEHPGLQPPPAPDLDPMENCVYEDTDWQRWTDWRAGGITRFVEKLVEALRSTHPGVMVSVSPNPQTFSKNCYLLDWQTWHERGLIDELVLQVYRDNMASFAHELSRSEIVSANQSIPVVIGILSGLRVRHMPSDLLRQQILMARERRFGGVAFFFYESLWNLTDEKPQQRQKLFMEALQ